MGKNRYLITYVAQEGNDYKKNLKVVTSFSYRAAVDSFCSKNSICNRKIKRIANNNYDVSGWIACRMLSSSSEPTIG